MNKIIIPEWIYNAKSAPLSLSELRVLIKPDQYYVEVNEQTVKMLAAKDLFINLVKDENMALFITSINVSFTSNIDNKYKVIDVYAAHTYAAEKIHYRPGPWWDDLKTITDQLVEKENETYVEYLQYRKLKPFA